MSKSPRVEHRPTPDVYFQRALATDGDWNAANYNSAEFDDLFGQLVELGCRKVTFSGGEPMLLASMASAGNEMLMVCSCRHHFVNPCVKFV